MCYETFGLEASKRFKQCIRNFLRLGIIAPRSVIYRYLTTRIGLSHIDLHANYFPRILLALHVIFAGTQEIDTLAAILVSQHDFCLLQSQPHLAPTLVEWLTQQD